MAADKLKFCRINSRPISPKTQMEQEKRIRREIANSNERRRMQSINAGFQSLRTLLPHHDGEKLSKVSLPLHSISYHINTSLFLLHFYYIQSNHLDYSSPFYIFFYLHFNFCLKIFEKFRRFYRLTCFLHADKMCLNTMLKNSFI